MLSQVNEINVKVFSVATPCPRCKKTLENTDFPWVCFGSACGYILLLRLSFNTAVFQATCIDVTTVPYSTGEVNASFGCYFCKDATDLTDEEGLIGTPGAKLNEIISSLEALSEKAIIKARSKGIYKLYGC